MGDEPPPQQSEPILARLRMTAENEQVLARRAVVVRGSVRKLPGEPNAKLGRVGRELFDLDDAAAHGRGRRSLIWAARPDLAPRSLGW